MLRIWQAVGIALWATAVLGLPIQDKQAWEFPTVTFELPGLGYTYWHATATVTVDHTTTTTKTTIVTSGSNVSSQLQLSSTSSPSITPSQVNASPPTNTANTAATFTKTRTITVTSTATATPAGATSPTGATLTIASTSINVVHAPVQRVTRIRAEAIPTNAKRSIPWAAKLTESSSLPAFTNSQEGTPGSKPTVVPALPRFRGRQVSTTLLVVQSESGVDVKTHTLALPFPSNPPWRTNSGLILPPQPTDAGDYTAPEGYTVSTHLYPITQADGIMTHTTITFLVEQTTAPMPTIVPDGDDDDDDDEETATTTAATMTSAVATPMSTGPVFPQPSTVTVTVENLPSTEVPATPEITAGSATLYSIVTAEQRPTSTSTVTVHVTIQASAESLQKLNPRQGPRKTRTSIIWQTTTVFQPNPYIDATPAPVRPRQHSSGLNPKVAVGVQQPRPNRPKKPEVIIAGDEAVVYSTRIATAWIAPGITIKPSHSTVTETHRAQATHPVPPTQPTPPEPKREREFLPDYASPLVPSDCQPFEKCHNENIEWVESGNHYLAPDMDQERFWEGVAYSLGDDYWNWRGSDRTPSGPPGNKFMGSYDGGS